MKHYIYTLILISSSLILSSVSKDPSIECSACLFVVNEINEAISKADPKETIDGGSFRVSPDGKQDLVKISYPRSELHLMEVMEDVCGKTYKYGYANTSGKNYYVPKDSLAPESKDKITKELEKKLSSACEDFIEENHDELLLSFRKENKEIFKDYCFTKKQLCSIVDVNVYMPKSSEDNEEDDIREEL
uniref:DUF3456 domain-containing protein n=1 Tax=Parastrongyloides trichosuri TaxID=131310 RepID=A0A0N4ZG29_PARTI